MKRTRPSNFSYLDPDAPRTRTLIDACLSALNPLPWQTEPARYEAPALVTLARRIAGRAAQGKTVQLKPDTARLVASAMLLTAEGPPALRESHPHTVEDRTREPRDVLAFTMSATLAIGAWEAYAPQHPNRRIVATSGGWITWDNPRA